MSVETWKNTTLKLKYLHISVIIMIVFGIAALNYLTPNSDDDDDIRENLVIFKQEGTTITRNSTTQSCNLFSGKWVYDNVSYPLYKEGNCELVADEFACEQNGRVDLEYQHWRWQPHQCDLPRFDGATLLEKLRDKKLVFVGDSVCRNQWRSLLCLTEPYFPLSTNKTVYNEGNFLNLHVKDYNATIAFYWAPYLVESDSDDIFKHRNREHHVRIKSIEKHGKHWSNADVLIFDSFAWWSSSLTLLWSTSDSSFAINKNMSTPQRAYEIALDTWADWLEFHIDHNKTKIFFTSLSPYSVGQTNWGTSATCHNASKPRFDDTCWQKVPKSRMKAVESTIDKLEERGVKVVYLNITELTCYREDAHPSIYMGYWKQIDVKQRVPSIMSDCLHWCLPGAIDVWNEILYAYMV